MSFSISSHQRTSVSAENLPLSRNLCHELSNKPSNRNSAASRKENTGGGGRKDGKQVCGFHHRPDVVPPKRTSFNLYKQSNRSIQRNTCRYFSTHQPLTSPVWRPYHIKNLNSRKQKTGKLLSSRNCCAHMYPTPLE